jgi:arylsulfatase A-like enzyme
MVAMPNTMALVKKGGANMSNFFVHTPICCPSRTTMLSGKYQHNNRVSGPTAAGCMRQNTSQDDNPQWWQHSFVKTLHDHGYATGLFGKVTHAHVCHTLCICVLPFSFLSTFVACILLAVLLVAFLLLLCFLHAP